MHVAESVRKSMRANRSKDTQPELRLRKALWAAGARGYRKNVKALPGKPDVAFPGKKVAVFLHGCFWHGCTICESRKNLHPKENEQFWIDKVRRNRERDAESSAALAAEGWRVIVIWEHEVREDLAGVVARILRDVAEGTAGA
jgi:DNA mismatch endonuclease (patch repair protein)